MPLLALLALMLLLPVHAGAREEGELAARILSLTGSRTKIVWKRGSRDDFGKLMCFDTAEGKERVVVDKPAFCKNPYMTGNGRRIVFTGPEQTAYVVDWDGGNLKPWLKGRHHYVLGTWRDEKKSIDWVYVGDNDSPEAGGNKATSVYRYPLDHPETRELLWDKTTIADRFCVGPDGLQAAGELPRPVCAVADFPNGKIRPFGEGCCANIAPDGSGRLFHMIGDHRHIKMYSPGAQPVKILLNGAPGNEKDPSRAIWRPKWSNRVRFFTLQTADQGPDADIALGRFDGSFSKVEAWVRITDSPEYDADALAFIGPEE